MNNSTIKIYNKYKEKEGGFISNIEPGDIIRLNIYHEYVKNGKYEDLKYISNSKNESIMNFNVVNYYTLINYNDRSKKEQKLIIGEVKGKYRKYLRDENILKRLDIYKLVEVLNELCYHKKNLEEILRYYYYGVSIIIEDAVEKINEVIKMIGNEIAQ